MSPNESNLADEQPTGTRNNYLNNMLDGIQANPSKKVSVKFLCFIFHKTKITLEYLK